MPPQSLRLDVGVADHLGPFRDLGPDPFAELRRRAADRLETDNATAFAKDSVGNVLGGVRTSYVDAPIAKLSGEGQAGNILCSLFGTTELLDSTQLLSLYPDHATFVSQVNASVDSAVLKGFLLAPDGDLIKSWAQSSTIGGP